jgi:hypothetical protein
VRVARAIWHVCARERRAAAGCKRGRGTGPCELPAACARSWACRIGSQGRRPRCRPRRRRAARARRRLRWCRASRRRHHTRRVRPRGPRTRGSPRRRQPSARAMWRTSSRRAGSATAGRRGRCRTRGSLRLRPIPLGRAAARVRVCGERDDRHGCGHGREQPDELGHRAGEANEDDDVSARAAYRAEIAVRGVARVHEARGQPERGERRDRLARDEPGLADAAEDDGAAARVRARDQVDRAQQRALRRGCRGVEGGEVCKRAKLGEARTERLRNTRCQRTSADNERRARRKRYEQREDGRGERRCGQRGRTWQGAA